jgi:hypothetical protein
MVGDNLVQVTPAKSGSHVTRPEPDQRVLQTAGGQYITVPKHLNKPSQHHVIALLHSFKVLMQGTR